MSAEHQMRARAAIDQRRRHQPAAGVPLRGGGELCGQLALGSAPRDAAVIHRDGTMLDQPVAVAGRRHRRDKLHS